MEQEIDINTCCCHLKVLSSSNCYCPKSTILFHSGCQRSHSFSMGIQHDLILWHNDEPVCEYRNRFNIILTFDPFGLSVGPSVTKSWFIFFDDSQIESDNLFWKTIYSISLTTSDISLIWRYLRYFTTGQRKFRVPSRYKYFYLILFYF